jgi:hypothetical protein
MAAAQFLATREREMDRSSYERTQQGPSLLVLLLFADDSSSADLGLSSKGAAHLGVDEPVDVVLDMIVKRPEAVYSLQVSVG